MIKYYLKAPHVLNMRQSQLWNAVNWNILEMNLARTQCTHPISITQEKKNKKLWPPAGKKCLCWCFKMRTCAVSLAFLMTHKHNTRFTIMTSYTVIVRSFNITPYFVFLNIKWRSGCLNMSCHCWELFITCLTAFKGTEMMCLVLKRNDLSDTV